MGWGVHGGRLVGQSDWSAVRVPVYLPARSFYDQRGIVGGGGGADGVVWDTWQGRTRITGGKGIWIHIIMY